jgi:hypothetical protein
MRSIPTALNTELLKEASFLAHLVVLSAATPLRYTDLDVDVWSGGNQYMARGFEFDGIEYSLSATVDKMGLRVDNVDQAVSSLVMSEEIRGKGASITLAALTDQAQVIATAQIFSGLIDMIEVDELSGRIDIVTPWILWRRKLPRRAHSATCPWVFKGTECGYTGGETWCDQTYERCTALSRTSYFGGFRWLPDLQDKQLWWGMAPSKKVQGN